MTYGHYFTILLNLSKRVLLSISIDSMFGSAQAIFFNFLRQITVPGLPLTKVPYQTTKIQAPTPKYLSCHYLNKGFPVFSLLCCLSSDIF